MDEKWGFVAKKEKNRKPNEKGCGDCWDHTAFDPEHALLLATVPGRRTDENARKVVEQVCRRTGGRTDLLITSDEHEAYEKAILEVYGVAVTEEKTELAGDLCYATVKKTREKGRVVEIVTTLVFGFGRLLGRLLFRSKASNTVNTSFVERNNGTDRHQNARKARKTLCFSKKLSIHESVGYFVSYSYNFCWIVRTLGERHGPPGAKLTPALSAGLTDHIWTIEEWITWPARPCQL